MSLIPFATQRSGGQDLATHLQNAEDNEEVEIIDMRGCVSNDLHGAFAEWKAQRDALTNCENELYSLSINPDHRRAAFTAIQYAKYLKMVEEKLGLQNQPRVVVRHVKEGREHYHAVYSRIDVENEKAIHLAFDKDKLMAVTRKFALEEGLTLPQGYYNHKEKQSFRQLTLYEKQQQDVTGITKQQRIDIVTNIWKRSDSAKAFVAGLEDHGYLLVTGRRPYLLIDIYGQVNALPKLIDDRAVKTKHIREFLEKEYPSDSLMDVEEAQELIKKHSYVMKDLLPKEEVNKPSENEIDKRQKELLDELLKSQAERREDSELRAQNLQDKQRTQLKHIEKRHLQERKALKQRYIDMQRFIRGVRQRQKPTGLAGMFARFTGLSLLRNAQQKLEDRKRIVAYQSDRENLRKEQAEYSNLIKKAQESQSLETSRKLRALKAIEQRELKTFKTRGVRQKLLRYHKNYEHMPSFALALSPPGRMALPYKAKERYINQHGIGKGPKLSRTNKESNASTVSEQFNNTQLEFLESDIDQDKDENRLISRSSKRGPSGKESPKPRGRKR